MKRVNCLAGVCALAPVAIGGLALPAAAAPHVGKNDVSATGRKSVVLPRVHARGDCEGYRTFPLSSNWNLAGHGWSTPNGFLDTMVCVGTVDGFVTFNKAICKDVSLALYQHAAMGIESTPYKKTYRLCASVAPELQGAVYTPHYNLDCSQYPAGVGLTSTYEHPGASQDLIYNDPMAC
jgi:hypothetical protein